MKRNSSVRGMQREPLGGGKRTGDGRELALEQLLYAPLGAETEPGTGR